MRVVCLKNEPHETPGAIAAWCRESGHGMNIIDLFAGAAPPQREKVDLLLIMGGSMSVNDDHLHPWLVTEKKYIEACVSAGKKILGICLGAQLLALILGARVYRNKQKEIGWFPVTLTPEGRCSPLFTGMPETFDMFHWHGDTFDLPSGSVHLAFSDATPQQAFLAEGRMVGLQFHPEMDELLLEAFVSSGRAELVPAGFVQSPKTILAGRGRLPGLNRCLRRMLSVLED